MICAELTLLSKTLTTNEIGVQVETITNNIVPIMKVEPIYTNEFYEAESTGFKPELRVRLSALNYNYETELLYNGITYSVIRYEFPTIDEVVLVCERKQRNV
jgi:SPP1 family predicted phage head-tail adaptor